MSQNNEQSKVRIKTLSQNLQRKVDGQRKREIPRLLWFRLFLTVVPYNLELDNRPSKSWPSKAEWNIHDVNLRLRKHADTAHCYKHNHVPSTPLRVLPAEGETQSPLLLTATPQGRMGWWAQTARTQPGTCLPFFRKIHSGEGACASKSAAEISGKQSENSRCLELEWL